MTRDQDPKPIGTGGTPRPDKVTMMVVATKSAETAILLGGEPRRDWR